MCITSATMSDDDALREMVINDNAFFKSLLDLVPAVSYFSVEEKNELLGNVDSDEDFDEYEDEAYLTRKWGKHRRKGVDNPLTMMSISEIAELQGEGKTIVPPPKGKKKYKKEDDQADEIVPPPGGKKKKNKKKGAKQNKSVNGQRMSETNAIVPPPGGKKKKGAKQNKSVNGQRMSEADEIEAKHAGKKKSRNAKVFKNKGKELQRREARLAELQARLKAKLEEMKAQKNAGKAVPSQEQKRLRRQEKKMMSKMKNTNITISKGIKNKEEKEKRVNLSECLQSPPRNKILNQNGDPVKSKFDFSMFSVGNDKSRSSDLHGKDYKRLLEKVEKRQEQVEELKQKDPEKGKKLEQKMAWQTMMSRAKGEKVKDDPKMLKKSIKRKEQMKKYKKKKWDERSKKVEESIEKRQQKRQANLDKRKKDKTDKKRKKLIKKGRIIPGF